MSKSRKAPKARYSLVRKELFKKVGPKTYGSLGTKAYTRSFTKRAYKRRSPSQRKSSGLMGTLNAALSPGKTLF